MVREYRWDQQNRLVRVIEGTHESVYEYDGASRRVRIKELTSGVETKNETFVWCGSRICQKRASNGSTVVRSYFGNGFEESGPTKYFYTRDHLGSVREVVGNDGTTVASRLSYDPWGKVTETGSGALSDFTYTGHYADRATGLDLTQFRAYDPSLGRWISRDPIGLLGGLNLYRHVNNSPVNLIDVDGLMPDDRYPGMPQDEIAAAQSGSGWAAAIFAAVSGIGGAASAGWAWLWGGSELAATVATTVAEVTVPEAAAGACGGAAASGLPALMKGPGGKMLGQAVGHLKGMSGAQRVGAFRQFAGQITSSTNGQWSAKELAARNATIFAGEGGEALVFDAAGNMFRGQLADRAAFAFVEGGQIEVNYSLLRALQ